MNLKNKLSPKYFLKVLTLSFSERQDFFSCNLQAQIQEHISSSMCAVCTVLKFLGGEYPNMSILCYMYLVKVHILVNESSTKFCKLSGPILNTFGMESPKCFLDNLIVRREGFCINIRKKWLLLSLPSFGKKETLCQLGRSVLHTDKSFQITKQEQIAGSQLISLMVQPDYQRNISAELH